MSVRLDDGVTFVHVASVETDDGVNPLLSSPAFAEFQREITLWNPPAQLGYRWHIARDASDATDVEISFVAVDGERTRLEIVHDGWERLGAEGPAWREANTGGWNALVPAFLGAVASVQP